MWVARSALYDIAGVCVPLKVVSDHTHRFEAVVT